MSVVFGACSRNRVRGPFAASTKVWRLRYSVTRPPENSRGRVALWRLPARADLRQALGDALFHAALGGLIKLRAPQIVGQAFHGIHGVFKRVGVLVVRAVAPLLHGLGGGV